jgi:UDP-glucose 4-epimerase
MTAPVILFGASGFIGRNLLARLANDNRTVIAVTTSGAPLPGAAQTLAFSALRDAPPLPADAIGVHVAAFRYDSQRFDLSQSDILAQNGAITAGIFGFCAERGVKELRMASSVAVYPAGVAVMDDAIPIDLNAAPIASEAFYAWSKRQAEITASLYAAKYGVHCVSFRLSNPYGPFDSTDPGKAHVAPAFVMKALDANPLFLIRGDAMVERDFTYVGDVVEVFVSSLDWRGRSDVFNVCSGRTRTLQDLAQTAMRIAGVDKTITPGAPGAFGPARRVSTNARIREALQMDFASIEDGMIPTLAWYRHAYRP